MKADCQLTESLGRLKYTIVKKGVKADCLLTESLGRLKKNYSQDKSEG